MTKTNFTAAELIFVKRMLPHFMAGKSVVEAAASVLDDDARLFNTFMDRGHSVYVPTPDERGTAYSTGMRPGDLIANEVSAAVHARLTACAARPNP